MILLGCKSNASPIATAPVSPSPEIILDEVLQELDGCSSEAGVKAEDNVYSFTCSNSADTHYAVFITDFGTSATAHAQFEASYGENPVICYHGYDFYETSSTNPNNRYVIQEQLGWQAGRWMVSIEASYDYGYFHFTADGISEALYASAVEHDLFLSGNCPTAGASSLRPE
jgi:hypothetical protein